MYVQMCTASPTAAAPPPSLPPCSHIRGSGPSSRPTASSTAVVSSTVPRRCPRKQSRGRLWPRPRPPHSLACRRGSPQPPCPRPAPRSRLVHGLFTQPDALSSRCSRRGQYLLTFLDDGVEARLSRPCTSSSTLVPGGSLSRPPWVMGWSRAAARSLERQGAGVVGVAAAARLLLHVPFIGASCSPVSLNHEVGRGRPPSGD